MFISRYPQDNYTSPAGRYTSLIVELSKQFCVCMCVCGVGRKEGCVCVWGGGGGEEGEREVWGRERGGNIQPSSLKYGDFKC